MFTPFAFTIMSLLAFLIIFNGAIFWLFFGKLKKAHEACLKNVDEDLAGKAVKYAEDKANFFGQESLGITQVRGNGILRITEDEIYFHMLMPARVFRFPIENITAVETPKSFLGKTKFVPLLKVAFTNDEGSSDSAAWLVSDLSEAKNLIEQNIK